jgi:hypothetical protein
MEKRAAAPDAQGIEAEIPRQKGAWHRFAAVLERKARFPARSAGNAPKTERRIFLCLCPAFA